MAITAEKLSIANYNKLDNIPIISQDLSTSGFTPVANTYYRHTGETTASFTKGVIYFWNGTGYAALGGSGSGGMTLNKYTLTINGKPSVAQVTKILNILNSAIRILEVKVQTSDGLYEFMTQGLGTTKYLGQSINAHSNIYTTYSVLLRDDLGTSGIVAYKTEFTNSAFSTTTINMTSVYITYLNDTEIT